MSFSAETFPDDHPMIYKSMEDTFVNSERIKDSFSIEEIEKSCDGDEDLIYLYNEMIDHCGRYLEDVCQLAEIDLNIEDLPERELREKRAAIDEARRILHTSTIDSINILARNMNQRKKDVSWAKNFTNKEDRSQYANFAAVTCFQLIQKFLNEKKKNDGE